MILSIWPEALLPTGEKMDEQPSVFLSWRTFWGVWFSVQKSRIYELSKNLIEIKFCCGSIGCPIYRNVLICSNIQVQKNHKSRGVLWGDSAPAELPNRTVQKKRDKTVWACFTRITVLSLCAEIPGLWAICVKAGLQKDCCRFPYKNKFSKTASKIWQASDSGVK